MGCRYERYSEPPICPKYEQELLAQYFVKQALAGSQNAQGLLELTPCDFWPLIQGRSLWLFGDSITMASWPSSLSTRFVRTSRVLHNVMVQLSMGEH